MTPGHVIAGKYQLSQMLARGGMGSVWRARHLLLDVDVAVKLMDPSLISSAEQRVRFGREAKSAAQIKSAHIVQIHDYGVDDGTPYITMELLEGEDLGVRLRREGRLPPAMLAEILVQIARGLARAHELGIVHRDLKPANIFLARADDAEVVKVVDFGIARAADASGTSDTTRTGDMIGSPPYMSPEQVRGRRDMDHRTDLWSVAVILYRALTGRLPFQSDRAGDLIVMICTESPPPPSSLAPDLPRALDAFFGRAFQREPNDRFGSIRELAEAFQTAIGDARPAAAPGRSQPPAPSSGFPAAPAASGSAAPPAPYRPSLASSHPAAASASAPALAYSAPGPMAPSAAAPVRLAYAPLAVAPAAPNRDQAGPTAAPNQAHAAPAAAMRPPAAATPVAPTHAAPAPAPAAAMRPPVAAAPAAPTHTRAAPAPAAAMRPPAAVAPTAPTHAHAAPAPAAAMRPPAATPAAPAASTHAHPAPAAAMHPPLAAAAPGQRADPPLAAAPAFSRVSTAPFPSSHAQARGAGPAPAGPHAATQEYGRSTPRVDPPRGGAAPSLAGPAVPEVASSSTDARTLTTFPSTVAARELSKPGRTWPLLALASIVILGVIAGVVVVRQRSQSVAPTSGEAAAAAPALPPGEATSEPVTSATGAASDAPGALPAPPPEPPGSSSAVPEVSGPSASAAEPLAAAPAPSPVSSASAVPASAPPARSSGTRPQRSPASAVKEPRISWD